jgi:hypothetical protein
MSRRARRPRRGPAEPGGNAAGVAGVSPARCPRPLPGKILLIAAATVLALWVGFLLVLALAR